MTMDGNRPMGSKGVLVVAGVAALCGFGGGAMATQLLAPPAATGQTMPRVVAAETYVLQDKIGRSRVLITTLPDGRTGLAFLDETGKPRAGLGFETNGLPGLAFVGEDGGPRAAFGIRADGTPALTLFNKEGASRVELSVDADGAPHLVLGDTQLPAAPPSVVPAPE